MAIGGVELLIAINAVVFVIAVAAAAYLLGPWREPPDDRREWYDGAVALVRELRETVEAVESPADPDRAARRLLPLSGRIERHVRDAPRTVDPAVHQQLFELAAHCQRVALEHRPVGVEGGPLLEDRLEALRADASALEAEIPTD